MSQDTVHGLLRECDWVQLAAFARLHIETSLTNEQIDTLLRIYDIYIAPSAGAHGSEIRHALEVRLHNVKSSQPSWDMQTK